MAALEEIRLPREFYGLYPPRGDAEALAWLAFESLKCQGREVPGWSSLVVHTTAGFAERCWNRHETEVLAMIYAEACRLVPQLPSKWRWARSKRWQFAHLKGKGESIVSADRYCAAGDDALIEFCGDYRIGDGVEKAALSGREAAQRLQKKIEASGGKK